MHCIGLCPIHVHHRGAVPPTVLYRDDVLTTDALMTTTARLTLYHADALTMTSSTTSSSHTDADMAHWCPRHADHQP